MGKPKPPSGAKRKDRHVDEPFRNIPWPVLYGAVGAAALASASALLITGREYWQHKTEAAAKTAEVKSAEEQMNLMGHKVELQGKLDTVREEATSLASQKEKAEKEKAELESLVAEAKAKQQAETLGPSVMAAQGELIGRLLEMAEEVERLRAEGLEEERLTASARIEAELNELEAAAAKEVAGTAEQKQKMALIGLVRSALESDRTGEGLESDAEWSEESLYKKHGLVTYASEKYWEEAYAGGRYGSSFDWYGTWEELDVKGQSLAGLVRPLLAPGQRNLVLGCGNSNLSSVLHQEGQESVVSVDISDAVIQQMRSRYEGIEGMEWWAMDVTKMDFGDGAFDFAIEKGLFDALYAGSGERVQGAIAEVARVLRPGARFVSVSFSADRMQRLFGGDQAAALSCERAGELSYERAKAADENASEGGSEANKEATTVHVYICERRP